MGEALGWNLEKVWATLARQNDIPTTIPNTWDIKN